MKNLLILFFCLTTFCVSAQEAVFSEAILKLESNDPAKPAVKTIRTYRKISIVTNTGKEYTFYDYTLVGNHSIASGRDTIAIADIYSIKGHVSGDTWRKVGGGALMVGGLSVAAITLGAVASGTLPYLLLAVPAVGVAYVGTRVAGARRFDTRQDWTLSIIPETK